MVELVITLGPAQQPVLVAAKDVGWPGPGPGHTPGIPGSSALPGLAANCDKTTERMTGDWRSLASPGCGRGPCQAAPAVRAAKVSLLPSTHFSEL